MKKKYIKLKRGQYLKDVLNMIESNCIYFKELTAIGATTNELEAERWSIILEPNQPVIKGKKGKHMLGVHEGIYVDDVILYIKNERIKQKKIMVTPESFYKIKEACEILNINIYQKFFLLFDECDRTMKDVAFRKKIVIPMEDFFRFERKAFISATAVIPTDPRFEEQNFELIYIKPDFDYAKDIEIIVSNNVSMAIKEVVERHKGETICIFLNSIQAITATITDLDIKEDCAIFCSRERMYPLKAEGYNAYEHIDVKEIKPVNLITSRFNSAVDINMAEKPVVILATNLHFANHTMIDPRSEAIQIVGRFRNGVGKLYTVTNINEALPARTENEAVSFLEGCHQSYNDIRVLRDSTSNEGAKRTLQEALNLVTYSSFVNEDGTKNHFMFDNFLYDESVKMIFKSIDAVASAYQSKHFNPTLNILTYQISDAEYKIPKNGISMARLVIAVVAAINKVRTNPPGYEYVIDNRDAVLKEIQMCYPIIYNAFFVLGEYELLKNAYSSKHITKAVKAKHILAQKSNFAFIEDLHDVFSDGQEGSTVTMKSILKNLIDKHSLDLRPEIKLLGEYFNLSPRKSLKGKPDEKGYKILSSKFNRKGQ